MRFDKWRQKKIHLWTGCANKEKVNLALKLNDGMGGWIRTENVWIALVCNYQLSNSSTGGGSALSKTGRPCCIVCAGKRWLQISKTLRRCCQTCSATVFLPPRRRTVAHLDHNNQLRHWFPGICYTLETLFTSKSTFFFSFFCIGNLTDRPSKNQ